MNADDSDHLTESFEISMKGENIRTFLNRRERELSNRIDAARAIVKGLEQELDEIQAIKNSIGESKDKARKAKP